MHKSLTLTKWLYICCCSCVAYYYLPIEIPSILRYSPLWRLGKIAARDVEHPALVSITGPALQLFGRLKFVADCRSSG